MNSTEVQNPQRKLHDKCLCLSYVFGSVLACAHVSEALLLALRTLSLTNNSSSGSKAFLCFIAFSGSPTAVHHPLHAQSQTSKFDGKTTIWYATSHMITHCHYVRVSERYTETLHMKKMDDLVTVHKFITLLTFELSSFRETRLFSITAFPTL